MFGMNLSKTNRALVGAFIGMFVVSLFIPVYLVFGITPTTALILFYLIPLTGAIVAFILSEPEEKPKEQEDQYQQLLGQLVQVKTKGKTYRGRLNRSGNNILLLSNVIDENNISKDHIFLEKTEISAIKSF
jgi:uncharacterized membrane protein